MRYIIYELNQVQRARSDREDKLARLLAEAQAHSPTPWGQRLAVLFFGLAALVVVAERFV